MNKILIVAATSGEITPYLATNPRTDILITGVGLTATAYALTNQLCHHHYDLVIQAGIGGSLSPSLNPGEVVVIEKDVVADEGAFSGESFHSITDLELTHEPEWLPNQHLAVIKKGELKAVPAFSVNLLLEEGPLYRSVKNRFPQAMVETMEGAGFHYVCRRKEVPFLQLRAISNRAGDRNKQNWQIENAIAKLNETLLRLVEENASK